MVNSSGKTLVLGAGGMLGHSLVPALQQAGFQVLRHARTSTADVTVDLANSSATHTLLDSVQPSLIVNLAGLTDVDACERNPALAFEANVRSVVNVADWLRARRGATRLLHISTDQVYEGRGPHGENSASPHNYYAFSKYAGELAAAAADATVIRTNFFGRSSCAGRSSLSDWLYTALQGGDQVNVFEDVLFSPLSLQTLCSLLVRACRDPVAGLYNLGSRNGMSKADFARHFAAALGFPATGLRSASVADANQLLAYRPRDMRMDCTRLETLWCQRLPELHEEILLASEEYRRGT